MSLVEGSLDFLKEQNRQAGQGYSSFLTQEEGCTAFHFSVAGGAGRGELLAMYASIYLLNFIVLNEAKLKGRHQPFQV